MTKILIVEDDDSVRTLAARALQRNGYEVELAADGACGLDCIKAADGRYDLVLHSGGSDTTLGAMDVTEGKGEWSGRVDDEPDRSSQLDLVDGAGTPVCSARLGAS